MTTNRQITKAIEKLTGYKSIKVSKAQGMCRFYHDSEDEQGLDLSLSDAIYVPRLDIYNPQEWATEFNCIVNEQVK